MSTAGLSRLRQDDRHQDRYPSRRGQPSGFLPRTDPVVYGLASADAPVDDAMRARYERDGFVVLPEFFGPGEVAELNRELDALRKDRLLARRDEAIREPGSGELRSIFRIHEISRVFSRLAAEPRLVDIAAYLLGDDVYVHQSRLNYKPGFAGREFYWHSDFETWHVEDGMPAMRALSISVTLNDNRPENGALMLIPGSHRHFVSCAERTPENHYRTSLRQQEFGVPGPAQLVELVDAGGIVSATGPAGSVLVFDCNTMHGSNGNITPWPRSNAFFVYNSVRNALQAPFSGQAPRPEYIAARQDTPVLSTGRWVV
jgi:ectoine hydroxylase